MTGEGVSMTGSDWPKRPVPTVDPIPPVYEPVIQHDRVGRLEARVTALEDMLYRNALSKHAVPLSEAEKAATQAAKIAGFLKTIAEHEEELSVAKLRIAHLEKANATLLRMVSQSEKDNLRRVLGEDI